ncbi:MAG: replication-associated recombination protein A [Provencibacterium sp.]|jgi:putative ATPase|nr:replication-associated recombination protein A [Provencibacterium sp.]
MASPLADRMRPTTLDEVVGQRHILGPGKVLRRLIEGGTIPNLIFYGPSGVGKTTVARILSAQAHKKLYRLNGTTASTADIKAIVEDLGSIDAMGGVILYLDEIQYLNKKQQQTLLEFIEDGSITLIASTTENPYFYIYNAILSRSTVFEFKPVEPQDIFPALLRAKGLLEEETGEELVISEPALQRIAARSGGDVRRALGSLEMLALSAGFDEAGRRIVADERVDEVTVRGGMRYDRSADEHYDILSAFQKSIRGSDENAALHYLCRLLEAGDLISACRRLLVCACEDIGLAYPQAIPVVKACADIAMQVGLPEAQLPLADAVILLCTAPKSNSATAAVEAAMADIKAGMAGPIPRQLQNKHYDSAEVERKGQFYLYPHDYPGHWVEQQYLPDALRDRIYYRFGENKVEQAAQGYREKQRAGRGRA